MVVYGSTYRPARQARTQLSKQRCIPSPGLTLLWARVREGVFVATRPIQIEFDFEKLQLLLRSSGTDFDAVEVQQVVCELIEPVGDRLSGVKFAEVKKLRKVGGRLSYGGYTRCMRWL